MSKLNNNNIFPAMDGKDSQKGIAIYLAVTALAIVLAIALGVNLISVFQMKGINEAGNSVIAFAAAETGIEWALYPWYSGANVDASNYQSACPFSGGQYVCPVPSGGALSNGATYSVIAWTSAESATCPAGFLCLKSIGKYLGTQRVIMTQQQ
jgi:hypothetical protein